MISQVETHKNTITCIIPPNWANPIAELEIKVNAYFSKLNQNIEKGSLKVVGERYVLFRGNNLSIDFVNSIQENFDFSTSEESLEFSQNFLYDFGSSIGKFFLNIIFSFQELMLKISSSTTQIIKIRLLLIILPLCLFLILA